MEEVGDMGEISERKMVFEQWWQGKDHPPKTRKPIIHKKPQGVSLSCETEGASIGYRIFEGPVKDTLITRNIKTWDFFYLMPQNGKSTIDVPKPWQVYTGETIPLKKGQTIQVNTHRIGYRPSETIYKYN